MNTKIIKLDINRRLYDKIVAKQDDTKSRFLLFQLLDGAVPFNLTNRSVRVYGVKPDGSVIFNDLTVTHSTTGFCLLELTNQMLAIAGTVKLEIMITEGDKKLTSIPFEMEVIKKINSNAAVESSNEFGALLTALKEIDQWNREFADKSGKLEELYTPRLNELSSQLETIVQQELPVLASKSYVDTKIGNMGNSKTFKGSCLYTNLPNVSDVNDYWYVTDRNTNYCWNGSGWIDIGDNYNLGNNTIEIEKLESKTRNVFYCSKDISSQIEFSVSGGLLNNGNIGTYYADWKATKLINIETYSEIEYILASFKNSSGSIILAGLCFYDENENFISSVNPNNADSSFPDSKYGSGTYILTGKIKRPSNAKYIKLGNSTVQNAETFTGYKVKLIIDVDDNNYNIKSNKVLYNNNVLNDILNEVFINNKETKVNFSVSGGLLENGGILVNSSWWQTPYISIEEGSNKLYYDTLAYKSGDTVLAGVCFLDESKTFISSITPNNAQIVLPYYGSDTSNKGDFIIKGNVNIPPNAKYVKFGNRISADKDRYYEKFIFKKVSETQNVLLNTEKFILENGNSIDEEINNIYNSIGRNKNWSGKKCGFIGDSMTAGVGTTKTYHSYLADLLGIIPYSYGVNGATIGAMYNQIVQLYTEHPDVDVIFIFGGTNNYNANTPIGTFYTETEKLVNVNGMEVTRKFRNIEVNKTDTFCNSLNKILSYAKTNFPNAKIILMTPIHRGYATFGSNNVQPNELYSNSLNLYIDDYVNTVVKASEFWSCNLINLFRDSGLYPLYSSYNDYFADSETDLLHPNDKGHEKIANVIIGEANRIKI